MHSLHNLGIRRGPLATLLCYGAVLAINVVSAAALLDIGF